MNEIQKANTDSRRNILILIVLLSAVILVSGSSLERIADWLIEDPKQIKTRFGVFVFGITVLFSPLLILGVHTWRKGAAVVRERRFPSSNMKVLVDTLVLHGTQAAIRGRSLQVAGILTCFAATGFPIFVWFILRRLTLGA